MIILIASVVLAVLSFWDDRQGLPIWIRLLAQGIAVVGGVLVLPDVGVFQGWLPLPVDRLLAAILWLWFINLYNFMDGIDGIAAVETIFLGFGIALLAGSSLIGGYATAISGAAFGFLFWNRPPAKIFLGDVGSVPLGYILGYLLLLLATQGSWAAALILPMYYLVDATVTLMIRLIDGQKIWLAHREHAYQRAVQRGLSHGAVTTRIALCNSVLVVLAGLTMQFTTFTKMTLVAAALGWCLVFWWRLRGRSR
ncbi:MAG: glycosyl transferase [Alphaproteobacteria bacterium]